MGNKKKSKKKRKKKRLFKQKIMKEVKKFSRDFVGTVPPTRILPDKTKRLEREPFEKALTEAFNLLF